MNYVLIYTSAPDAREKAPLHFADHRARWQKFVDGGRICGKRLEDSRVE